MKNLSISLFACAIATLAGCTLSAADPTQTGATAQSSYSVPSTASVSQATATSAATSTGSDGRLGTTPPDADAGISPDTVVLVAPAPGPALPTSAKAPVVSPGTLVSCETFDVLTGTAGETLGSCAATTATGKPRILRAFEIVSVTSPVSGAEVSIMVGFE